MKATLHNGKLTAEQIADQIITDYKKHYDFPWQGESHMHDCISSSLRALSHGEGQAWRCVSPPCKCSDSNYRQCAYAHYSSPPAPDVDRADAVNLAEAVWGSFLEECPLDDDGPYMCQHCNRHYDGPDDWEHLPHEPHCIVLRAKAVLSMDAALKGQRGLAGTAAGAGNENSTAPNTPSLHPSQPYWMIERGSPAVWFRALGSWTDQSSKAQHYPSKDVAEHFIETFSLPSECHATEHIDCDGPHPSQDADALLRELKDKFERIWHGYMVFVSNGGGSWERHIIPEVKNALTYARKIDQYLATKGRT